MTTQEIKESITELVESRQEAKDFFKEVREMFKETAAGFKEIEARFKETEVRFKETDAKFKETDASFEKSSIELEKVRKLIEANGKQIKKTESMFTSQWGKLIESLVNGKAVELFNQKGILVERTSTRQKGNYKGENYEFDIIAHNGNEIVIIEVKSTLNVKHIIKFKEQLKNTKVWLSEYKTHTVYGAIAYLNADEQSPTFAENQGLWVIRATGDSASIINQPAFKPKVF